MGVSGFVVWCGGCMPQGLKLSRLSVSVVLPTSRCCSSCTSALKVVTTEVKECHAAGNWR